MLPMAGATKESTGFAAKLDAYFSISGRGSSFGQEVRGGLTTFLTMSYIIFVNPDILSTTGMDRGAVFVAITLD